MKSHAVRCAALGTAALALFVPSVFAQCEGKKGFAKALCEMNAGNSHPAISGLGQAKNSGITTTFADAIHGEPLPPTFDPKSAAPLLSLERNDDGAFVLKAGIYEATVQSFTLDAGDPNSTKPAGYYPAPIKGRFAKVLASLLKNAELHPDIPQSELQQLVIAVAAGTDLEKMPAPMQQTALRALPKDTLKALQGAAQANAFNKALMDEINKRIAGDRNAQKTLGQMNDIAQQMQPGAASAQAQAELDALPEPVARGAWAQMQAGFYVRYLPEGYVKTRLQIIVPDSAAGATFDPTQYLAVLGQAPSERLGISLRPAR